MITYFSVHVREGVQGSHEPREMTSGASSYVERLPSPGNLLCATRYASKPTQISLRVVLRWAILRITGGGGGHFVGLITALHPLPHHDLQDFDCFLVIFSFYCAV